MTHRLLSANRMGSNTPQYWTPPKSPKIAARTRLIMMREGRPSNSSSSSRRVSLSAQDVQGAPFIPQQCDEWLAWQGALGARNPTPPPILCPTAHCSALFPEITMSASETRTIARGMSFEPMVASVTLSGRSTCQKPASPQHQD